MLSGPTSREALAVSVAGTLLMAWGLWHLTGRFDHPTRLSPGFIGAIALGGLVFGNVMVVTTYAVEAAGRGITIGEAAGTARSLGAEFVFWLWLYVLVAAGAYGTRFRLAVRQERERRIAAQAAAAEAQLRALRGQLNPHFLFNALHGVSALVRRDTEQAELALERLADLLRFSLDRVDDPFVSLREELDFTRTYVELERLGLEDRLRYEEAIDPEALNTDVPPFAVQTLVENALRHAVAPRVEGGSVHLTVRRELEVVQLEVRDDGSPGASTARNVGAGGGRGLSNLRDRVHALYGAQAVLDAAPHPEGGFCATLRVPGR